MEENIHVHDAVRRIRAPKAFDEWNGLKRTIYK